MEVLTDQLATQVPYEDIDVVSAAVMLRLPDSQAESRRVRRMRELLWSASELNRALAIHTQHALVDCSGSHGTGDLASDTRALHGALVRYAQLVRVVANEYRDVVRPDASTVEADLHPLAARAAGGR